MEANNNSPDSETMKVAKNKYDYKQKTFTKETLFDEILLQNTYTDIVDLILKYHKSVKGTPGDLVNVLDFLKEKLLKELY